jgi:hypothetical protein
MPELGMSRSKNRNRRQTNRRRATIVGAIIGALIIFTFVIGLIAPDLGSRRSSSQSLPTFTPFGTSPPPTAIIIPTPDPDPQLEGELPYIHSGGYFQTFLPAGTDWYVDEREGFDSGGAVATVSLQSPERLVVIFNYIQPGIEFESPESYAEAQLTLAHFASVWADYQSWLETGRAFTPDSVIVDFALVSEGYDYVGRTITRLEDGWIYVTRLVTPANNPALLDLLEGLVLSAFVGYHDLLDLPGSWPAYIDRESGFVLKHPAYWRQVAGGKGRPVTFASGTDQLGMTLRLRVVDDAAIASAEDAAAWVTEEEDTASVLATEPVEREYGAGFQVAYSFRDPSGDAHSGLMVLLNDASDRLMVANLQLDQPDLDLLTDEALGTLENEAVQAVTAGFTLLPAAARPAAEPGDADAATE